MDVDEYRIRGKEMVDYIADYLQNIRDRKVYPDKKPGFLSKEIPDSAPAEGEAWPAIFDDIEKVIMPGVTHWQSPHMHGYFGAITSYPSMLGEMLTNAINCIGFTWASSPIATELETIVMNWLGKMVGLPADFLHENGPMCGGGVIQTSASEATFTCLLAGRTKAIKSYQKLHTGVEDAVINARLVAYCSDQAHSSVQKASLIGLVKIRYIESDERLSMRGDKLHAAIKKDRELGLIPFWVCATLGTTGACAFDNLEEISSVCVEEKVWLHVDAAYAGSAFTCPEFRIWMKGIEKADSFAFNPSKWLMVHFDFTAMWVKDSGAIHQTFNVDPIYLHHEHSGVAIDYMHWQVALSRRFRAVKLWFVLRNYGISGIQKHIREGVRLGREFEALVSADSRFEIPAARYLGVVVFRLKGENHLTEMLLKRTNARRNLHCVPAVLKSKYVIRFVVSSQYTTINDILEDWEEFKLVATEILSEIEPEIVRRVKLPLGEIKSKNKSFGTSLLLVHSPGSLNIVNGSYAAIFDHSDILDSFSALKLRAETNPRSINELGSRSGTRKHNLEDKEQLEFAQNVATNI